MNRIFRCLLLLLGVLANYRLGLWLLPVCFLGQISYGAAALILLAFTLLCYPLWCRLFLGVYPGRCLSRFPTACMLLFGVPGIFNTFLLGSVVLAPVLYPLQLLLAASRWLDPMVFTILAPIPGFYTLPLLARLVCRAAGRPSC